MKLLAKIYEDIDKNIDNNIAKNISMSTSLANYKKRLGQADQKRGVILVDPVNLVPINAVPSKPSTGKYLELNKLAEKKSKENLNLAKLFQNKVSIKPKAKTPAKPKVKSCPPGKVFNPKTKRCKKA